MKRISCLLAFILLLTVVLSGCSKPTAASQAKAAYQEILNAAPAIQGEHPELQNAAFDETQNREQFGNHIDWFALADLNQDGVPELIAMTMVNFRWTNVSVYTYADGKAVLLNDPIVQNSAANGAYTTYLCADNHIHSLWRGTTPMGDAAEENTAFALSGNALTAVSCTAGEDGKTIDFAEIAKPNTPENVAAMMKNE